MDATENSTSDGAAAPERKVTNHTPVLMRSFRNHTMLRTGLISAKEALSCGTHDSFVVSGMYGANRTDMRLGIELPLLEVAYKGLMYRTLVRPIDGQDGSIRKSDLVCELVRTVAPGMKVGGEYLERPDGVPNTPRALTTEMLSVTGATVADLVANAYSIFHYRLDHEGLYPDSMTPAGYTLGELFLLSDAEDGRMRTLYETPTGTNVEKWTLFLKQLDENNARLAAYVTSSMALKEFGEAGVAAMREALKRRAPRTLVGVVPMNYTGFLTAFPIPEYQTRFYRDVGTSADWF